MPSYLDYHGLQTFKGELDEIFAKKADLDQNGKVPLNQLPEGVGEDIIDDTAGEGDTDKTWSADKLSQLEPDVPVEDVQIDGVSILENGAANITLAKLGAESGITLVETVSGTTPTITGQPNIRYMCGEVATLDIVPPEIGTIDVTFTSGTTATVLTVPSTVMFPIWFDPLALDANTVYEIMVTDGVYGAVMTWAN